MPGKFRILTIIFVVALFAIGNAFAETDSNQPVVNDQSEKNRLQKAYDQVMQMIREQNPEKGKELQKLRKEKDFIFENKLRQAVRSTFAPEKTVEILEFLNEQKQLKRLEQGLPIGSRMRRLYYDLIKWLEDNYPQEASRLKQIQDKDKKLFVQNMTTAIKKYRDIMETERTNPQLADLMKKELQFNEKIFQLQQKIENSKDEAKKKELIDELKNVLGKKYDVLIAKKQLAYDSLKIRLENLKKQLERSEEKIKNWKSAETKELNIKQRLEEILNNDHEFTWK